MEWINDMLMDGYVIKEVSINNVLYKGKTILHFDVLSDCVNIEFTNGELLTAPLCKLDWIRMYGLDE